MTKKLFKRDDDEDLTIWMTITSTYTLSSQSTTVTSETPSLTTRTTRVAKTVISGSETTLGKSANMYLFGASGSSDSSYATDESLSLSSSRIGTTASSSEQVASEETLSSVSKTLNNNTESGSLKVGLAIGLPLAVASLFVAIIVIWYYFKRRVFRKRRMDAYPFKRDMFEQDGNEKLTTNEIEAQEVVLGSKGSSDSGNDFVIKNGPSQQPRTVKNFINRFSRAMSLKHVDDSDLESSRKHMSILMSPMFLRKFHLNSDINRPENAHNKDYSFNKSNGFLSYSDLSSTSRDQESDNYKPRKKPNKFPPIINTYRIPE